MNYYSPIIIEEYIDLTTEFYDTDIVSLIQRIKNLPEELSERVVAIEMCKYTNKELSTEQVDTLKKVLGSLLINEKLFEYEYLSEVLNKSGLVIEKYTILYDNISKLKEGTIDKLVLSPDDYEWTKEFFLLREEYEAIPLLIKF